MSGESVAYVKAGNSCKAAFASLPLSRDGLGGIQRRITGFRPWPEAKFESKISGSASARGRAAGAQDFSGCLIDYEIR